MTSNSATDFDNDFYEFCDWVELFNDDSASADIGGWYLTDNYADATRWRIPEETTIPAHEVLLIWMDGRDTLIKCIHTNFKLSADGEELALFSDDSILVDSITYPAQHTDISFGRNSSTDMKWRYFGIPTPGRINGDDGLAVLTIAPAVSFSHKGGVQTQPITLTLSTLSGTIHYTTDCSIPTENSPSYTEPIQISTTTAIRARTFEEDAAPGPVITHTYIFDYTSTLPVFSVVTDSSHLWDDSSGIYCTGVNGTYIVKEWGFEAANYNQPWERPINIEMYDNGSTCFNQTAGIRIQGEYVRLIAQKPFSIYGRGRYSGAFNYQFFPDKPITTFNNFILRPGGNDWIYTMFNEGAIIHTVSHAMDLDIQAYRPAVLFLNGEYWGLYNIREKINEDYLEHNYGLSADNVDMLENLGDAIAGSNKSWFAFLRDISDRDMSDDANFKIIEDNIDINEFINYIITEVYFANYDWPVGNIRYWRQKNGEGKWRWILVGLDLGFANHYVDYNSLMRIIDTTAMPDQYTITGTILFRKCLENASFQNRFIQLFSHHLSSTFAPARVENIIYEIKSVIAPEMPKQIDRWKDAADNDILPISSFEKWNDSYVEWMVSFARQRAAFQRSHITEQFELDSCVNLTVDFPQPKQGAVHVYGSMMSDTTITEQFYKNIPITLTAYSYPGYTFEGWDGISDSNTITVTLESDSILHPRFLSSTGNVLPDTISSDRTLTENKSPYFIRKECVVTADATLTCEAGTVIKLAADATLRVHGGLLLSGSKTDNVKITGYDSASPWGAIIIENSTTPSVLSHVSISGSSNGPHPDVEKGAVSVLNASVTLSHCTFYDVPYPFNALGSRVRIDSSCFSATQTGDLLHVIDSDSAAIRNNRFIGNGFFDTDAIDFDNVRNGILENNVLSHFTGYNSDGIDLGEGCSNITVCGNHIIHCADKGISVGQASTAEIRDNLISDCAMGIGIKDNASSAEIFNNNFCYNDTDVAVFEKNTGAGGGNAEISNCVFFHTASVPVYSDQLSRATVSWSVSTSVRLPGTGNIQTDPFFSSPVTGDYTLPETSPCRTKAKDSPYPIIGTSRAFDPPESGRMIISEIHYLPRQGTDYEFIELYNPSEQAIDIGGYWLSRAINYTFPESFKVEPGKCVVVSRDSALYKSEKYSSVTWSNGKLANEGDDIILRDGAGNLVDGVSYHPDSFPEIKVPGVSIELISPDADNALMSSWRNGAIDGSPGVTRFEIEGTLPVPVSGAAAFTVGTRQAAIRFYLPKTGIVDACLYDMKGRLVKRIAEGIHPGKRQYTYALQFDEFAQGVYLFSFKAGDLSFLRPVTIVRR